MKCVVLILVVFALTGCQPAATGTPASPEEAKVYIRNLGLGGVEMKAAESFGGQQLVEITGQITNKGARNLRKVDLVCVFHDPYNEVVLRETVAIVRADKGGLKAGGTAAFRLPFDQIPKAWNQTMPQMVIGGVVFD